MDFDAGFVVLLVFFCVAFGELGGDVPASVDQGLDLGSVVGVSWWGSLLC